MAVWHYGIIFTNSSKKNRFASKWESLFIRKLRALRDFFAGEEKYCTKVHLWQELRVMLYVLEALGIAAGF